jgi:hypothetical protein
MRRMGKSWQANKTKEALLDAGHRVMVVTRDSVTLQRRRKHLTMIETLPRSKPVPLIVDDHLY